MERFTVNKSINNNFVSSAINSFMKKTIFIENLNNEINELVEDVSKTAFIKNVICHCDCVFKSKTALAIFLFHFIPRCQYYCAFFAFRRTGTHPPYFFKN